MLLPTDLLINHSFVTFSGVNSDLHLGDQKCHFEEAGTNNFLQMLRLQ